MVFRKIRNLSYLCGLQVVHWDRQSTGVRHDRADRLVDLYASGEQRNYGPLFLQRKMNISSQAFSEGDFSLSITNLRVCKRRVFNSKHRSPLVSVHTVKKYHMARGTLPTGVVLLCVCGCKQCFTTHGTSISNSALNNSVGKMRLAVTVRWATTFIL